MGDDDEDQESHELVLLVVGCIPLMVVTQFSVLELQQNIGHTPAIMNVPIKLQNTQNPLVATFTGLALGDAFDLTIGCHTRISTPRDQIGLHELSKSTSTDLSENPHLLYSAVTDSINLGDSDIVTNGTHIATTLFVDDSDITEEESVTSSSNAACLSSHDDFTTILHKEGTDSTFRILTGLYWEGISFEMTLQGHLSSMWFYDKERVSTSDMGFVNANHLSYQDSLLDKGGTHFQVMHKELISHQFYTPSDFAHVVFCANKLMLSADYAAISYVIQYEVHKHEQIPLDVVIFPGVDFSSSSDGTSGCHSDHDCLHDIHLCDAFSYKIQQCQNHVGFCLACPSHHLCYNRGSLASKDFSLCFYSSIQTLMILVPISGYISYASGGHISSPAAKGITSITINSGSTSKGLLGRVTKAGLQPHGVHLLVVHRLALWWSLLLNWTGEVLTAIIQFGYTTNIRDNGGTLLVEKMRSIVYYIYNLNTFEETKAHDDDTGFTSSTPVGRKYGSSIPNIKVFNDYEDSTVVLDIALMVTEWSAFSLLIHHTMPQFQCTLVVGILFV